MPKLIPVRMNFSVEWAMKKRQPIKNTADS